MKMNFSLLAVFFIIGALSNQVWCDDGDYKDPDYADDDAAADEDDEEDSAPPRILSTSQTLTVTTGGTISLECNIENESEAVVQWRKNGTLALFFDATRQISDKRYEMDKHFTLHIKDIKKEDAGNFTCELLGYDQSIQYTVEIASTPKILRIFPDGSEKVLRTNSPLTLMCEAVGNPEPTITWTHKKKHSSIEQPIEGEKIIYDQVSKNTSGTYTCTAKNRKGEDKKSIKIDVLYEPEVKAPKEIIHSAEGYESELKCTVHAHPPPNVTWHKDNKTLSESHHIQYHTEGSTHILRITNTKESDFGTYKCVGTNDLGTVNMTITLTGLPSKPVLSSTTIAADNKSPVLKWKVTSFSPIIAFEMMYKKQQEDSWNTVTPSVTVETTPNTFIATQMLGNLEPGTYVARIKAKNMYGWSSLSETRSFSGDTMGGGGGALQSTYLETSMSGGNNLEIRISIVFTLSLLVARFLS